MLLHLCATLTVHWTVPFDKLVPTLILIKVTLTEHHAVVLVMFKLHASLHPVAIKSFFWRVVQPVLRCSMHHSHHCLTEWQQRRLWQSTSRIQIVPDPLFSLLSHLYVSQAMCVRRPSSQLVMLVIAKNGTRKCEFGDGFNFTHDECMNISYKWRAGCSCYYLCNSVH